MILKVIKTRNNNLQEDKTANDELVLNWINSQGGGEQRYFQSTLDITAKTNRISTVNLNGEPVNNLEDVEKTTRFYENSLSQTEIIGLIFLEASPYVARLDRDKTILPKQIAMLENKVNYNLSKKLNVFEVSIREKEANILRN